MKYRRLSKEQFEELHLEFINFLATQSITAEEWKKIKAEQPKVAEEEMDIFSDLVWEGVLGKVKYLENIAPQHLYLFQIKASTIALIGLKINSPSLFVCLLCNLQLRENPQFLLLSVKLVNRFKIFTGRR